MKNILFSNLIFEMIVHLFISLCIVSLLVFVREKRMKTFRKRWFINQQRRREGKKPIRYIEEKITNITKTLCLYMILFIEDLFTVRKNYTKTKDYSTDIFMRHHYRSSGAFYDCSTRRHFSLG